MSTITIGEWIAIHKDLDAYIANGGRLLDLRLGQLDQLSDAVLEMIVRDVGIEQWERLGRFYLAVATVRPEEETKVGDVLSEDQLRAIWRETAAPEEPG
jgi:hypothetical protein